MTSAVRIRRHHCSQLLRTEHQFQLEVADLKPLGLGSLSPEAKAGLVCAFNTEFDVRVTQTIHDRLSPEELLEVEYLVDIQDAVGVRQYLEHHGVDRTCIVQRHFFGLVDELKFKAAQILEVLGKINEGRESI